MAVDKARHDPVISVVVQRAVRVVGYYIGKVTNGQDPLTANRQSAVRIAHRILLR